MKKNILLLMVVLTTTICANAQFKIGILNRNLDEYSKKGDEVLYTETKNGKVKIYGDYLEEGIMFKGTYAKNVVYFSGFYYGQVNDPRDDYVSIRKGPGTNYPIVGKEHVTRRLLLKKTDSNWYKVYGEGSIDLNDEGYLIIPSWWNFRWEERNSWYCIGYIYKDRIITPIG